MKKTLFVLFLFLLSFLFTTTAESSTTYYVSTTTGDDNNTGTFTDPFKTIQKAINLLAPGDTIQIREGTYYETVFINNTHGTTNQWITIKATPHENVIIDGRHIPNRWNHSIIKTTNISYIHLTGLTLANSAFTGIWISQEAHWVQIDNTTIQNCSANAFHTQTETSNTLTHITFSHNIVDNVNNNWSGNGSSFNEAVTFRNVQNFDISHNHISHCGKECIDAKHGSAYGAIHHNHVDNTALPGSDNEHYDHIGIYIDAYNEHSHDIDIFNNKVIGSSGSGIAVGIEQPTGSLDTINIYNNIVDVTGSSACGILLVNWGAITGEPISDVTISCNTVLAHGFSFYLQANNLTNNIQIQNNIFLTTLPTILNVKYYDPTPKIILKNNLYYTTTESPRNEWNGSSNISWGNNAIIKDPLLKSDYRLQHGSPAIDHGTSIPLSEDYWGNPRPRGTTIDIGAYEYPLTNQPPINQPPIADLTAGEPYVGDTNTSIFFDGSRSYDPDGTITTWVWTYGDNTTGCGQTTIHQYNKPGTYPITLTITDNQNTTNTATTTCNITQNNRVPTPPFITGPRNGTVNTTYSFTALSTDPDSDMLHYTFIWGDTNSAKNRSNYLPSNTSFTANHTWLKPGQYIIDITVIDSHNASSNATYTITIEAVSQPSHQTPGFETIFLLYIILITVIIVHRKHKKQ